MALNIEETMNSLTPKLKTIIELEAMKSLGGPDIYRGAKTIDYSNPLERKAVIGVYRGVVTDSAEQYVKNPQEILFL